MKLTKAEQKKLTIDIEKLHTFLFNLENQYKSKQTKEIFIILDKLYSQFQKAKSKLLRNEFIELLNQSDFTKEQNNDIKNGWL